MPPPGPAKKRARRSVALGCLLAFAGLVGPPVLLYAVLLGHDSWKRKQSVTFYADRIRGPCPPDVEFFGVWMPLPDSPHRAQTPNPSLLLASDGTMEMHDMPGEYVSEAFEHRGLTPVSFRGRWATASWPNRCVVQLRVKDGAFAGIHNVWVERTNGHLRLDFVRGDDLDRDVIRYEHS
ncbi:MAG TPA: hypothetical protein VMV18_02790 [bacterium]|nr:hypothetical protein [bacterium]